VDATVASVVITDSEAGAGGARGAPRRRMHALLKVGGRMQCKGVQMQCPGRESLPVPKRPRM
jgi:hypothetical protein